MFFFLFGFSFLAASKKWKSQRLVQRQPPGAPHVGTVLYRRRKTFGWICLDLFHKRIFKKNYETVSALLWNTKEWPQVLRCPNLLWLHSVLNDFFIANWLFLGVLSETFQPLSFAAQKLRTHEYDPGLERRQTKFSVSVTTKSYHVISHHPGLADSHRSVARSWSVEAF